jgi:predicted O-methyltransferase YrrM
MRGYDGSVNREKLIRLIARAVPAAAKRPLREPYRRYRLGRALARARSTFPEVSDEVISDLVGAWANTWSIQEGLIPAILREAAYTDGPILDCGSGLSTILLGMVAQERNGHVTSLEHIPEWAEQVNEFLKSFRIDSVDVHLTPLKSYGDFDWYDVSGMRFSGKDPFSLVVCDGPPGTTTRGGRFGLVPVMLDFLRPDCVILLDDANREPEQEVLDRWSSEYQFQYRLHGTKEPFAEVARRPPTGTTDQLLDDLHAAGHVQRRPANRREAGRAAAGAEHDEQELENGHEDG